MKNEIRTPSLQDTAIRQIAELPKQRSRQLGKVFTCLGFGILGLSSCISGVILLKSILP